MAGDVIPGAAIVWSRAGLPSRMIVEWRTSERGEAHRIRGPHCVPASDFTGRVELTSLPPGQTILYKVQFEDLANGRTISETTGHFRTPPGLRDIRFLWSGDMCGQGFGIPKGGSIPIFEEMRRLEPDFFIHSGDTIYADGPIPAEVTAPDGVWRNEVSDDKAKVAETLDEFRGAYRYNLLDKNFREFISSTAQVWQWDDHEVMNNWSPSKSVLNDARYHEKNLPLLVARAGRAFHDYAPLRSPRRVYRKIEYGPLLDLFVL